MPAIKRYNRKKTKERNELVLQQIIEEMKKDPLFDDLSMSLDDGLRAAYSREPEWTYSNNGYRPGTIHVSVSNEVFTRVSVYHDPSKELFEPAVEQSTVMTEYYKPENSYVLTTEEENADFFRYLPSIWKQKNGITD